MTLKVLQDTLVTEAITDQELTQTPRAWFLTLGVEDLLTHKVLEDTAVIEDIKDQEAIMRLQVWAVTAVTEILVTGLTREEKNEWVTLEGRHMKEILPGQVRDGLDQEITGTKETWTEIIMTGVHTDKGLEEEHKVRVVEQITLSIVI